MWQNSIFHPTNYAMTNSISSTLTFIFMNKQMCTFLLPLQFNTQHSHVVFKADLKLFKLTELFLKVCVFFKIKQHGFR